MKITDKINKVHHLNFLKNDLPDKCANLIIADPPYYKIKGEFDFIWKTFEDYLSDVEKWAIECKRILSDNGTLFWYGDDKNIAYAQIIFDKYFNLENSLVWYKYNLRGGMFGSTGGDSVRSFPICTERILMYSNEITKKDDCIDFKAREYIRQEILKSKGKINLKDINEVLGTATNGGGVASACLSLNKSEPTMITKELYKKLQKWCYPYLTIEYEKLCRPFNNTFKLNEVLQFNTNTKNEYEHDTVKPETLTRALIITCSRENDLVIVPFAGSGTECAMSVKENRNFIGFEIEEKYVNIANKRIKNHVSQQKLF